MSLVRARTLDEAAEVLASRRKELGWSLSEVADRMGVSPSTVMRWEAGDRRPGRERLESWARVLGVEVYWSIDMVTTEVPQ